MEDKNRKRIGWILIGIAGLVAAFTLGNYLGVTLW